MVHFHVQKRPYSSYSKEAKDAFSLKCNLYFKSVYQLQETQATKALVSLWDMSIFKNFAKWISLLKW